MHFCTECGNMYYIRLTETNSIVYYCRNCGHEDDTITIDTVVVSQTALKDTGIGGNGNGNVNVVNKYTKLDPTLPRISTILCPNSECPCNRSHNATQYADRATIVGGEEEPEPKEAGKAPEEADAVPREVIYLRYDDIRLKYIYLCAVCNTIWNTEHI